MAIEQDIDVELPSATANGDTTRLATGALVNMAGKVFSTPLRFMTQIILARWLGPETYGLYAIGWTVLSMVQMAAPLGLDRAVMRFLPRYWRQDAAGLKSVLFETIGVAALSGFFLGAAIYLAAPWLAETFFQKPALAAVLRIFALVFPLQSVLVVASMASRVSQRMQYSVYSNDVIQPVVNLALVLILLLAGWGLLGGVWAGAISIGLACGLALYYVRHLFPEAFSGATRFRPMLKELLAFSLPAYGAGIFVFLISRIDRLVLGYFRPAAEVGIYQTVGQFSIFFEFFLTTFMMMLAPMIVELDQRHDRGRLESLYRVSTKWSFYLILPVFLVVCFAPREVMMVVFGAQYVGGAGALVALAVGQFINVGTGAAGALLVLTGYQRRWLVLTGIMCLVALALNVWLAPQWGLMGVAVGTTCIVGGLNIIATLQVKRVLGIWPYDRRYIKGLLAMAAAAGALYLLRLAPLAPLFLLISAAGVAVAVFVGVLLWLKLDPEDGEFIRLVQARLARLGKGAG